MHTSDIGLIGLAVMGENLALNFESKGFTVSVFNRLHPGKENVVDRFLRGRGAGKHFIATYSGVSCFPEAAEEGDDDDPGRSSGR